jgi:hypothetical protein
MSKSSTVKTSAIGAWPDFITKFDLDEAAVIERETKRLVQHRDGLTRDFVKKSFDEAATAYSQSPTDESFGRLKELAAQLTFVEQSGYCGRARTFVHEAIRDNLKARFVPWAGAIIERGLTTARAKLADVVTVEEAHHRDVTGEALGGQPNAIIEKATQPVLELERILASINEEKPMANENEILSFLKFLRDRAAKSNVH